MSSRQIDFDGDDAAYIRYLETLIFELQQALPADLRAKIAVIPRGPQPGALDVPYTRQFNNVSEAQADKRKAPRKETRVQRQLSVESANDDDQTFHVIEYTPAIHRNEEDEHRPRAKQDQSKDLSKLSPLLKALSELRAGSNGDFTSDDRITCLHGLWEGYIKAMPCLSEAPGVSNSSPINMEDSILSDYAQSMINSFTSTKKISCIQELIFVSLCAVSLRNNGTAEKEKIYTTMRTVLGTKAGTPQLQKLIRGAKWANHAVSLLTASWKTRSWDVLFFSGFPVSYYSRLSDSSVKPEDLIKRMSAGSEDEPMDDTIPLAVPFIIEKIFKNSVSLDDICDCLGYSLSVIETYRPLVDDALQRKRLNSCTHSYPSKKQCSNSYPQREDEILNSETRQNALQSTGYGISSSSPLSDVHPSQAMPANASLPMDMQQGLPTSSASNDTSSANTTSSLPVPLPHHDTDALLTSRSRSGAGTVGAGCFRIEPIVTDPPDDRDRGSVNNAESRKSSTDINGGSLTESSSRLPLMESSTFDQSNVLTGGASTGDFQNNLFTLFDFDFTSAAPPDPILWSLFGPENESQSETVAGPLVDLSSLHGYENPTHEVD